MADLTTLKNWLTQAETAYHELQIGAKTQELRHNGRIVVYTPADANKLSAYIGQLRNEIAQLENNSVQRRRPIYISPR